MSLQFDGLADVEAYRAGPLAQLDPAFTSKLPSLVRLPAQPELHEVLLSAQAMDTPPRYIQRVTITPLVGKGPDVRAVVLERGKARQAQGIRTAVSIQAAGPAAGTFVVNNLFENLGDWEKMRTLNLTDASFQQYTAKMATLTANPAQVELFEVLIPYQPR